ncbi:YfhL family 4Fe-4S dicluster ferredoxin [Alcaligenes sp. Marseille-Q7550]
MALHITEECINCDVCEPQCPNMALYMGEEIYEINPNLCTECVGHFDEPQCVVVCPVECIEVHPQHQEDQATLMTRFKQLQSKQQP